MRPILISHRSLPTNEIVNDLLGKVEPVNQWNTGSVGVLQLPRSYVSLAQAHLEKLNAQDPEWVWNFGDTTHPPPAVAYGKGSIPPHVDDITGLTILLLILCNPWDGSYSDQSDLTTYGQFFSGDSDYHSLKPGQALVFNDSHSHAWMTNSAWMFATLPLTRYHK